MKKRLFARTLLVLLVLPLLCVTVSASQTENAFPFEKYEGKYLWISSGYPSREETYRKLTDDPERMNYQYGCYIHVSAHEKPFVRETREEFDEWSNTLAKQSGTIYVTKVEGLWENKWEEENYKKPHIFDYYIGFVTDHDEINRATPSSELVENWKSQAAKGLSDSKSGTLEVTPYGGGWLYTYNVAHLTFDKVTTRSATYRYLRPISEIPGAYLSMEFQVSSGKEEYYNDATDKGAFDALCEWRHEFFASEYIIKWNDDLYEADAQEEGFVSESVTQDAESTPGEDGGVIVSDEIVDGKPGKSEGVSPDQDDFSGTSSVPGAVAVGIAGIGAALGAAAAASGQNGSDQKKKKKSYRMYVQKDFGDAIRRGAEPVKVRARMAEITSGKETDRPDLTAGISVSGDGAAVHGAALVGRYCEATVSVPKTNEADTATVTFRFQGKGGQFTNNIVFRLVDGPALKFIEETTPGSGMFRHYGSNWPFEMIPGDGFQYSALFTIADATKPPELEDMEADHLEGFEIGFEKTNYLSVYRLTVKNRTKPEPEHSLFAKPAEHNFTIRVRVEGEKEPLTGYAGISLYPEGLTVQSRDAGKKNGIEYVRVQAYEKETSGDFDRKWQVSEMKFTLAIKGEDKALIDPDKAEFRFGKLKGAGGLGAKASKEQSLAEKYEYKEEHGIRNGKYTYNFEPNTNLCEPDDGTFFVVLLPMRAEYDGRLYEAEVPLRLRGKDPDPFEGWETEYKKLRERIEKYSLPENRDYWLKKLEDVATDPRSSTVELRLTSKYVIRQYMRYWTIESMRYRDDAANYDVIISWLEWAKFFGDCAFSLLVSMYAGPVAEAIISPAKDFFTGAVGEVIAAVNYGETIDMDIFDRFEFSKNLAAAGDNLVSSSIDITNWRRAAATLGAYFVYAAFKNYIAKLNEGENDLYGALVAAFSDMTVQAVKNGCAKLFELWAKNSKAFQEKIAPKITQYFRETKFANLQMDYNNWQQLYGDLALKGAEEAELKLIDVLSKYLGDLVGAGCSYIEEKTLEQVNTTSEFGFSKEGHITFSFTMQAFQSRTYLVELDVSKILMNLSCPFFGWLYDFIFGSIPVSASVIDPPKDPPLSLRRINGANVPDMCINKGSV